MLPSRLGVRFALEALFLVLLAVGAGLADLRPLLIVAVMAVAWVLVALIELTAERIARSPISYLLPASVVPDEDEPPRVFWPRPEERTVVAPPEPAALEPEAEPAPAAEPEYEPEPQADTVEPVEEEPEAEPPQRRRKRFLRRRAPEVEADPPTPPRHVKLLPRRSAPEPSSAAQEVAELFGSTEDEEARKREESGG